MTCSSDDKMAMMQGARSSKMVGIVSVHFACLTVSHDHKLHFLFHDGSPLK